MAATDLTTAANIKTYGVRRYSRKYGSLEEVTIIIDEQEVFDGGPTAFDLADTVGIIPVAPGDMVIGGFGKVLVAATQPTGGAMDFGVTGGRTEFLVLEMQTDATAGTYYAGDEVAEAEPVVTFLVDDTLDLLMADTGFGETTGGLGRLMFVAWILRGSDVAEDYESYAGDPNTPPQT